MATPQPIRVDLPIADIEAERAVLGSILVNPQHLQTTEALIQPRHLASERHRLIYAAMLATSERGVEVDMLSVRGELAARQELESSGGVPYLASLTDGLPRVISVESWARAVREKARRRAALELAQRFTAQIHDDEETDAAIEHLRAGLEKLADAGDRSIKPLREFIPEASRDLEEFARGSGVMGVPTGLVDLDRLTGGLCGGRLWIVAAFTSRGKSALSTQIACHAAERGKRVLLYSMEMPPAEVAGRILLGMAGIDRFALKQEKSWARLAKAMGDAGELPLWFDPRESPTVAEVRASARRHKAVTGCDLIVVDYLQRLTVDGKTDRWQAMGDAVKGLKSLARNLNVPVLAACQLNMGAEDKRPTMANLAQAAQIISQESDLIAFLHPTDMGAWNNRTEQMPGVSMFVDKHRNGPTATIDLVFDRRATRFHAAAVNAEEWRGCA